MTVGCKPTTRARLEGLRFSPSENGRRISSVNVMVPFFFRARWKKGPYIIVGLQPTVIASASRAPHLLLEQSGVDVRRPSTYITITIKLPPLFSMKLKYYRMWKWAATSGKAEQRAQLGVTFGGSYKSLASAQSRDFTFLPLTLTGDARLEFLRNSARRLKMRERIERAG